MRHAKLLSAFLILLVIIFSLIALVNPKANLVPDYSASFVPQSFVQEMNLNQGSSFLNQTTHVQIYNFITNNPGLNFRGICNALTLPIGVVQYHLVVLMKGDLVSNRRNSLDHNILPANLESLQRNLTLQIMKKMGEWV